MNTFVNRVTSMINDQPESSKSELRIFNYHQRDIIIIILTTIWQALNVHFAPCYLHHLYDQDDVRVYQVFSQ